MIKRQFYEQRKDGVNLYRTYSDDGFYILQEQTGIEYDEAIDVEDAPYTYRETDNPIVAENQEEATAKDYKQALQKLGANFDE